MKKRFKCSLVTCLVMAMLLAAPGSLCAEILLKLTNEKSEYVWGEPVILRLTIRTTGLSPEELKAGTSRSGEKIVVAKEAGRQFPPLPVASTSSHSTRSMMDSTVEEIIFLQPLRFWGPTLDQRLPEWRDEFLSAGSYTVRVEQTVLLSDGVRTLRSNTVEFAVHEPSGRSREASSELTSHPTLLSLHGSGFLFPSLPSGDSSVLQRIASFGQRYCDTPYGQFALAQSALYALAHDRLEVAADLYPALGRMIELCPQQDFVALCGRFSYLVLENLLEDHFDPKMGLVAMRAFDSSLTSPPLFVRQQVRRMTNEYQHVLDSGQRLTADRVAPLVNRLSQRGDLPTDAATRYRRHNIALGMAR